MIKKIFAVLCSLCFLAGCAAPQSSGQSGGSGSTDEPVDGTVLQSAEGFAAKTGASLLTGTENVCYSPISLYFALAMAGEGATGETQAQILELLGAADAQTLADGCAALMDTLERDEKDSKLILANSIWTNKGVDTKQDYQALLRESFSAEAFSVSFGQTKADNKMSDWVKKRTQGLLCPEFQHDASTLAVLLNTIYLKDAWAEPFYEELTESDDFTTAAGESVQAEFMHGTQSGSACEEETYTKAALSFESGGSMTFVLPKEGVSLEKVLSECGLETLLSDGELQSREITWSLPKFQQGGEQSLIELLQSLGVTDAFDPSLADFSTAWAEEAYISEVRQGALLTLDEEGVEAAAYTEIAVEETALLETEPPLEMDLNRPFLYALRSADGTLLFLGVCENPAAE